MGWLIAAGILCLFAVVPIGVRVCYDASGFSLNLLLGPASILLFPRSKKENKTKNKTLKDTEKTAKNSHNVTKSKRTGGSITEFRSIIKEAICFLNAFRRRLVIKYLEFTFVMAENDPCDLACHFGQSSAVVGSVIPLIEEKFRIRKRKINISCDFLAEQPTVIARIDVVIAIGQLIYLVVLYGIRILKEYFKLKNLRKGGSSI